MRKSTDVSNKEPYRFGDLVDMPAFARMLESFFRATGIPNGVVDASGELLSLSAGQNACARFHRTNPQSAECCRESNLAIMHELRDGCVAGGLCRNGLMDYATAVVVEGQQLATLFLGQVLHTPPDLNFFRAQAARFGYDEADYLDAIKSIPVVDKTRLQDHMEVMVEMAQTLSASGLARLRQTALEHDISIQVERNHELMGILDFSPDAIFWSDDDTGIGYLNRRFTQLFGYTRDDLPDLETWSRQAYRTERYRETVIDPWRDAVQVARKNNVPPPELEADIVCKDGTNRRVVIRASWIGRRRLVSFADITERKEVEDAIAARERAFRTLAENSPDPIYRYDRDGRRLYVNAIVCELSQKSEQELIGKSVCDESILLSDQRQKLLDAIRRTFDGGENEQIDLGFVTRAGDYRDYQMRLVPERDELGQVISVLAIARDITEMKNAQRQMTHFVGNIPGFAFSYHLSPQGHGNFLFASPGIENLYGLKPADVRDDVAPLLALTHSSDVPRVVEALAESARAMTPVHVEYRICRPGLPERWAEFRSTPVSQANGSKIWHGIIFDISERKRMEEALSSREREFRSLAENLPNNIARWDAQGRYNYINPTCERTIGVAGSAVYGKRPCEAFPDGRFAALEASVDLLLAAAAEKHTVRLTVPNPEGGWFVHEINLVPEFDAEGRVIGVLALGTDISDILLMQEAIAAREQAFRSLAESSPDVVIRVDLDLRIRYLNANMVKALELDSAEEVIGRQSTEVWPDGRFNEIDVLRERVVISGKMDSVELAVPAPGGKIAYHHVITVPERDTDGHIIGTLNFGRDVTAIRETERRLNSLVENLPGIVYTIRLSPQGELSFPYVSAGVEEIYGITPEEAMGDSAVMRGFLHPDDKVAVEAAIADSARMMMPFRIEVRICPPGQPQRWVSVRADPQAKSDSSILWYGLIFDITERKRLEDTLRTKEAQSSDHSRLLQAVLESSPGVIVFALDQDYRYLAFNEKHSATMHAIWGKEIAVGMNMLDVIGDHPDRGKAKLGFDRALSGEAFIAEEAYGDEGVLRMYWQNFFAPIRDENGAAIGLTCFVLNITERKQLELRVSARDAMLEMVSRGDELSKILNAIVLQAESEDKTILCSVLLLDQEGTHLLNGAAPSLPAFYNEAVHGLEIGVGVGSCGTAAALGQRVIVEDIQNHDYWKSAAPLALEAGLRSCWSEPILSSSGKVLGTFAIYHGEPQSPQPEDIERIAFAANLAAIAIENRHAHEELERRAYTDYLTGLANRRYFLEQAENELARTLRYGKELSILMLDVDRFKQVNDTYGHKVGDLVLQKLSELFRTTLRDVDIVGRIGGEEFALLLPETGVEQAMKAAERLRAAIASAHVSLGSGLPLRFTVSLGVTNLREKDVNIDVLLNQADQALYRAKGEGRNRVCMYQVNEADL